MGKKFWIWVCFGIFILSCNEDETFTKRNYPFIESLDILSVDNTGASVTFNVKNAGTGETTTFGVEYTEVQPGNVNEENRRNRIIEKTGFMSDGVQSVRLTHDIDPGRQYQVRPFIKSGSFTVYGYPMVFTSLGGLAPEIEAITNRLLVGNSEIEITGNYFSTIPSRNQIEIPGLENFIEVEVLESSVDQIKIKLTQKPFNQLPVENKKYDLKITVAGKSAIFKEAFSIGYPHITDISPLKGHVGTTIFIELNDVLGIFNDRLHFNENGFSVGSIPLTNRMHSSFSGTIANFPPGIYPLSIQNEFYTSEFSQPFEVLNSWSVFLQGFPFPEYGSQKIQVGRNVVFMGTGGWTDISFLNIDTGNLTNLSKFDGIYTRLNQVMAVGQDRFLYFGLGTQLSTSERLNDFSRLDIQSNTWEKLPDFPLENPNISHAFEFQGNIIVIPFSYTNFQVFDVSSKSWRESTQAIPALLRSASSITIRGNEIFFIIEESNTNVYRYIIGQAPQLIGSFSPTFFGSKRSPQIMAVNDEIYIIYGTSEIFRLDLQSSSLVKIQSIFDSFNSSIMPLNSSDGLLMAFPLHPTDYDSKNIIYKLQLDE